MAEISTKPYLIRAIHEWCTDSGYRPYIAVAVDEHTVVPREFVRNGEIVLNVSASATNRLNISNELIEFEARFGGVARVVSIPIDNVSAIYAQETGHGMAFEVPKALALVPEAGRPAGADAEPVGEAGRGSDADHDSGSAPSSPGAVARGQGAARSETEGAHEARSDADRVPEGETARRDHGSDRRPRLAAVPASTPRTTRRRRKDGDPKPSATDEQGPQDAGGAQRPGSRKADPDAGKPGDDRTTPPDDDPKPAPPSGRPHLTRIK